MKRLLLAGAVMAAVGCASEPSAAVKVSAHKVGAEGTGDGHVESAPSVLHPLTPTDEALATTTTTTAVPTPSTIVLPVDPELNPPELVATTAAPRRTTANEAYEAVPSPQGRTTGRGSEPPAGDVLERIAGCESGSGPNSPGSYTAQNPRSTASGRYQFLDSTWQGMDAAEGYSRAADAPPAVQDAAARELLAEQGTTPWDASRGCWS